MQPDLILIPFGENATPGTINTIPETRGPGDDPQQATWNEGFPQVVMTPLAAGGIPPQGQDVNGVLKAISEHTVFTGRGGQYKWSTAYVAASGGYSIGDVIQADDGLNSYVSLVNTNTANFNTTPASIGVSWALYAGRKTQTQATETVSGIAEIATQAEVTTGADDARIVTPAKLRGAQATQAEAEAGTDNTKLMTPLRARQQRDKAGFAIDTGTANTYVCAFTPSITARIEGQVLKFKVNAANTGASTFNDGAGVVALVGGAQAPLQGGELIANGDAWVQWNTSIGGGSYQLLSCTGAALQVSPATQSRQAPTFSQVQSGAGTFGIDAGAANNIQVNIAPFIGVLIDGMEICVLIASSNTGATTLNLNGTGASPVRSLAAAALQGGELFGGGRAVLRWASAQAAWILYGCQGGSMQVGAATGSLQAVQLGQLAALGMIKTITRQVFTASGTYTPSPGMVFCDVEMVGGGGGGGGATAGSGTSSTGGGGGGGGYSRKLLNASAIGASKAVNIGVSGTAGPAGNNTGGTGGTTSLGALMTATGGIGGGGGGASSVASVSGSGGQGGVGTGGDTMTQGTSGFAGFILGGANGGLSGAGGGTLFGAGGYPAGPAGAGISGLGRGSGGSGGASTGTSAIAGPGGPGYMVITEYCTQ